MDQLIPRIDAQGFRNEASPSPVSVEEALDEGSQSDDALGKVDGNHGASLGT